MNEPSSMMEVYQLHVWLCEISPLIWRRLLVRSDSTIADLHYTLQIAPWAGMTPTYIASVSVAKTTVSAASVASAFATIRTRCAYATSTSATMNASSVSTTSATCGN